MSAGATPEPNRRPTSRSDHRPEPGPITRPKQRGKPLDRPTYDDTLCSLCGATVLSAEGEGRHTMLHDLLVVLLERSVLSSQTDPIRPGHPAEGTALLLRVPWQQTE
jgi:hypothetical protein